jgi:uncharacterized protein (TIGR02391 family)
MPQPADLSPAEIMAAIPRIQRRVDEFKRLDIGALTERDGQNTLDDLKRRTNDTLMRIFGLSAIEYETYHIINLDDSPLSISDMKPSIFQRRSGIQSAVGKTIAKLQSLITILTERVEEFNENAAITTITAYKGLNLHHEIARAASKLYQDGHYANAVEAAVKALNGLVRLRAGLDIDGMGLMERAFSPNNPILRFNDLSDQSDRDEQKGFMMLFCGAVAGLRHPRAHKFIHDEPERALEFIAFVSLLAKLLDEAR